MKKLNVQVGTQYGRLTVLNSDYGRGGSGQRLALFRCQCGIEKVIILRDVTRGHTVSCGCLQREQSSAIAKRLGFGTKSRKYPAHIASAKAVWRRSYNDGCSFEKFLELSQQQCFYCGAQPSNKTNAYVGMRGASQEWKNQADFIYNGLDRIDSSKLHTEDNIVPCCYDCNSAKMDMAQEEFYDWLVRAYTNLVSTGRIHMPPSIRTRDDAIT